MSKLLDVKVEIINEIPQDDLNHIVGLYKGDSLNELDTLGRGSYGEVYGYKDYAVKYIYRKSDEGSNDIEVLKDINHLEYIPTLYAIIDEDLVIVERIYGDTVKEYCYKDDNPLKISSKIILDWEDAINNIMDLGWSPEDLHERNVMIDKNAMTIKIVDVGFFAKHDEDESYPDVNTYRKNGGYKRAQRWTGDALRSYIERVYGQVAF